MKMKSLLIRISILFLTALFAQISWGANQSKVQPGESVYSILKKYGFNDGQRNSALAKMILPESFVLSTGDLYSVDKNKASRIELSFFPKNAPKAFVFWREGSSKAGANIKKINFTVKEQKLSGRIRGSLVESIADVTNDELVAYRFMDAFLFDYNLPKVLQRNAAFTIVFEKLYNGGTFIRNGEVLRADLEIQGELVSRRFEKLPGGGGVFVDNDLKSDSYNKRNFFAPVDYVRVSSLFQLHRYHPIKKFRKVHAGIDFELPEGEPVFSTSGGRVLRFGKNRAAGRFVVLQHENGFQSFYNHLSEISPHLKPGLKLLAGTAIGRIGCSGYCTNPHLHFAMKKNGQFVDPIKYIRPYSFNQRFLVGKLVARNN